VNAFTAVVELSFAAGFVGANAVVIEFSSVFISLENRLMKADNSRRLFLI
jgi:hypothetical protein